MSCSKISRDSYQKTFELPSLEEVQQKLKMAEERKQLKKALKQTTSRWRCNNCTFVNSINDTTCAMCELGWTGRRECPRDKVPNSNSQLNQILVGMCWREWRLHFL